MARPLVIELSATLRATPEEVWPWLTDWDRLPLWMTELSGITITSEQREGVGVTAKAQVKIGVLRTTDKVVVTAWERPNVVELSHLGWVKGTGRFESKPEGAGTTLLWRETLIPPWGLVGFIGLRFWLPLMRRIFRKDLVLLSGLVGKSLPE